MPEVDYEAAWQALKAEIVEKPSHGARDLALTMSRLEVEHAVPAGQQGFDPAPRRHERPTTSRSRVTARHG